MSTIRLGRSFGPLVVLLAYGAVASAEKITIDDFSAPSPARWSGNLGLPPAERPLSIILVDVDPYVFTVAQVQWIADFVASGGALLVCGGPNTFGNGQTCFFSRELDEAFKSAVENDDHGRQAELRAAVRDPLFARGVRPRVLAGSPEWEIGYRQSKDTIVLTAVNHGSAETETQVTLRQPPFVPQCVLDAQGRPLGLTKVDDGVQFSLRLPARCGTIVVAYPARPAEARLEVLTPVVRRSESLRYRVTVQAEDGSTARGRFVLPVAVTDPRGQEHQRYAPAQPAIDGVYEAVVPLAANAALGKWQIVLTDRFSGGRHSGEFTVR